MEARSGNAGEMAQLEGRLLFARCCTRPYRCAGMPRCNASRLSVVSWPQALRFIGRQAQATVFVIYIPRRYHGITATSRRGHGKSTNWTGSEGNGFPKDDAAAWPVSYLRKLERPRRQAARFRLAKKTQSTVLQRQTKKLPAGFHNPPNVCQHSFFRCVRIIGLGKTV